ncbi:YdaS family helix-turn-helix protein [Gluconobacter oxydans]
MEIDDIIRAAGGPQRVGGEIGRSHSAVCRWRQVPAVHVCKLSKMSGIAPHLIRPDVFPAPDEEYAA